MIMKILSTIVLLLTAVTLSAQPDAATCTGQTCTGQGSAIGFATVSFFSETDSSAVYGALADSTGRFSVRIPHGNYRMEIALLGYEKKQRGITIAHDTDLGRIVLDPSEISLQGVEVKAAPIVREADRFIVNVADMPQAIGRTAVEMLKLSPGVWIRDDIAIFGKKGAKVMINNRLLRETGEDLINYLNQIPAEDILRIEIVPNSGAEYDADMTAGIIKITLKRKRDNGIDGAVGIYYSHAFSNASSTTSPSFNLNYRNDRLSLYASMGTWFGKQIVRITESSAFEQNDASIRSESRLDGRWKSVSPRIGALYEFNDRHSAGLEVSYFRNLPGGSETHNRLQKQDKADSTRIASHFLQNQQGYGLGISANYIFKMDTTGSLFKLLLDYYRRDNDDPTDYFSRYTGSQAFDTTYRGDIHTVNDLYAATAAFEIALGPVSKLRTGAKYTLNRMNTAILYEFLRDDAWHRIDRQSNLNRYSENIGALYADFSTKFKNGIGLNVGLRGEYTYAIPATSSTLITSILYYSKDVESFGTGLKRIADACNEANCRFAFKIMKSGFVVVFFRSESHDAQVGAQDAAQVGAQDAAQVGIRDKILVCCQEPRSRTEIAAYCGYKSVRSLMQSHLKPLLESGQLRMTIPDKPNSRNQKYVAVKPED